MAKIPAYSSSLFRCINSRFAQSALSSMSTEAKNVDGPRSTVVHSEVDFHTKLGGQWWNKSGPMGALHALNQLRVPFIRDGLLETTPQLSTRVNTPHPLKGVSILEVGCGGGILTEPLARIGADVTGLDASGELIRLATERAQQNAQTNLEYVNDTIESFRDTNPNRFDAVVASEVLEHVNDKELFIESCVKVLRPGGSLFLTSLNKTNLSWLGAILVAENLLRIVPSGTHNWEMFISPEDLSRILDKYSCRVKMIHGMCYNVIKNQWSWSSDTSINYAIQFVKRIKST